MTIVMMSIRRKSESVSYMLHARHEPFFHRMVGLRSGNNLYWESIFPHLFELGIEVENRGSGLGVHPQRSWTC